MNLLNSLKELINSLQSDKQVIRFKELEKLIDHNEKINKEFTLLLQLQKDMVQKEHKASPLLAESITKYEAQKAKVLDYFIVHEYLELLDNINNDLSLIQSIIEQEISIDFD